MNLRDAKQLSDLVAMREAYPTRRIKNEYSMGKPQRTGKTVANYLETRTKGRLSEMQGWRNDHNGKE